VKTATLTLALVAAFVLPGCAGMMFGAHGTNMGMLYADTRANEKVTDNAVGKKSGEACSTSILGWVTTGDSSVPTAARAGGITKVASVDNRFTNILGVWAEYCAVVTGD